MRGRSLLVAAVLAAACESSTEPPIAQIVAATAPEVRSTVGTEVIPAPTVRTIDENGRPVAGIPVSFQAGGGGTIAQTDVKTDKNGLATVGKWTLSLNSG